MTKQHFDSEEIRDAIWPQGRKVPTRLVRCRHCGKKNRVDVSQAALEPERHACGNCGGPLFFGRDEPLAGLGSEAYQHSLDRRSLATMRAIPGVPRAVKWLHEQITDKSTELLLMSDAIRCTDQQFPELLDLVERARSRLGMDLMPDVYLGESPYMNAMTTGVRQPVIVVRSALLDQMDDDELLAIIGHELGHLHADHPLYHSVASALVMGGASASAAVRMLGLPIQRLLLRWLRHSELTADRAALLASRDVAACIGVMLTFAGGNRPGTARRTRIRLGPFVEQCRKLASAQAGLALDGLLAGYLAADRTHPYLAQRVNHLIQWVEHGRYLNILAGEYPRARRRRKRPLELPAWPGEDGGAAT
jgi:Zn-dependent protease with chaperone function